MVILATPPGFRPIHFEAAVQAGKNIFMEKPVATDAPGVRRVLAAAEEAKKKDLKVGVGLQRHHSADYIETIKRFKTARSATSTSMRVYWNGTSARGKIPARAGSPEARSDRNGIPDAELVLLRLALRRSYRRAAHPQSRRRATGSKACCRSKPTAWAAARSPATPDDGEIFDHHAVELEYADGSRVFSQCRHIPGTWQSVSEAAQGTKGTCQVSSASIDVKGGKTWRFAQRHKDPYQVEHDDLFAAIRSNTPYNEAQHGAESTMMAIFGRMLTYCGQELTWDDALNHGSSVMPKEFSFQATPPSVPDSNGMYPIAQPGKTRVLDIAVDSPKRARPRNQKIS